MKDNQNVHVFKRYDKDNTVSLSHIIKFDVKRHRCLRDVNESAIENLFSQIDVETKFLTTIYAYCNSHLRLHY